MKCRTLSAAFLLGLTPLAAQDLEGAALQQALNDEVAGFWVYDDLDAATGMARASGKPLLVSFRCVP